LKVALNTITLTHLTLFYGVDVCWKEADLAVFLHSEQVFNFFIQIFYFCFVFLWWKRLTVSVVYVNKWIPSWERTIMTISALYQTNTLQRDCYIAQESALSLHSDTLNRPVCNFPLILLNGKQTKTNCEVFSLTERGRTHDLIHWRRAS
jgi:hypothetical protein